MPGLQIFKSIKYIYGIATLKHARKWELFARKKSSTFEQLNFLHNCKRLNILPNSINYQPPVKSAFAIRTAQANGRRMLKVLITESHIRLRTYQRRIEEHRNAIFTTTNTSDAKLLQDTINNITQEYQ
jgi:phosphoribosyl-dephospho-CoA transferase